MLKIEFATLEQDVDVYVPKIQAALDRIGIAADISRGVHDPADVDYVIFAPNGPLKDFAPFNKAKLVQNLWAGVETIVGNQSLTQPLARMVDPGMTERMGNYVLGHIMRHHLDADFFAQVEIGEWDDERVAPLAGEITVGFLGLGELGLHCAGRAVANGYRVCGWSRTLKTVDGIDCYAGPEGIKAVVAQSDILVLLMPSTAVTANTLNAKLLTEAKKGICIINPGRGPLIDDDALLEALDSGHVYRATLDVFRVEPLPTDHPFWTHPRVLVTPHIAAATHPDTSAEVIAENIRRAEAGEPVLHLVDRNAGY